MQTRAVGGVLLFLFTISIAAEKQRSVRSGASPCQLGSLDQNVSVNGIALDDTHVYYYDAGNDNAVFRVPKNGGERLLLGAFAAEIVFDIAVDDTTLYVATVPDNFGETIPPGTIYAIPKSGGARQTLAAGVNTPVHLATDATHVYWVAQGTILLGEGIFLSDGKIERILKNGASRQELAAGLSVPVSLVLDDTSLYFSEFGLGQGNPSQGVRRMAKNGGTVTHLEDRYFAIDLAQTASEIIFFGGKFNEEATGLYRVPKNAGPAQLLVLDEEILSPPRIFLGQVYYVRAEDELSDALMRIAPSGGTPQFLRLLNMSDDDIELDECGFYFSTNTSELFKGSR